MSLLLGPEPFQKFVVGGWVLNWILVLRFGPNLELRLEAGPSLTKTRITKQEKEILQGEN